MADKNDLDISKGEPKDEGAHFPGITISLDATLTRGGGLLIFHKIRKIYFYSLDWSRVIQFPDTLRIHLFNAAIALDLFEEFLEPYPRKIGGSGRENCLMEKLICETKYLINENGQGEEKEENEEDKSLSNLSKQCKAFLAILEGKLKSEPFQGEWKYIEWDDEKLEGESDGINDNSTTIERKICKRLAEEDCSLIETLPEIEKEASAAEKLVGYSVENVSESVSALLAIVSVVLQFPQ